MDPQAYPRRATAEATAEIVGKATAFCGGDGRSDGSSSPGQGPPSHERGRAAASDQTSMAFQVSFDIGRWQNRLEMTLLRADAQ